MKKFIIWIKINWARILLIGLGIGFIIGLVLYSIYISNAFNTLENFTKRQAAGQMALQMPMFLFVYGLFMVMQAVLTWYFMTGRGMGSLTKKSIRPNETQVKWQDVIGMEEAKKEALEVVQLIKDQSLQKAIGGGIIKGTLLLGPPGCGKTYLAKAMATECGLPMLPAVGSEFVAMFMGQGAARMRSLFKQARAEARIHGGCIIFIDEIDAFAQPRQTEKGLGATTSHNATINQFLTEMDGLSKRENNIVVIAATNAEEDDLDPAIMRSGRFDRKIYVEKPNTKERVALLQYYLGKVKTEKNINIELLADRCKWFSPSDINNLVQEAGVLALRDRSETITQKHLDQSLRRLLASIERMGVDKILSERVNIKWDDLIGMEETKKDAWEIVELLRDRHRLKVIGGQIIKGIMMIGPPGCGKTYLAKAMATECGYPFITATGTDFINRYIGSGTTKLQEVFKEARKIAKTEGGCIIFIDEIDAFIRPRETRGIEQGGDRYYNSTINQFLAELDGLKHVEEGHVVVLAATNVPEEKLDDAVMRSGRFDRKIYFHKPSAKDREKLIAFYLSKVQFDKNIDIPKMADKAKWFSPADINNMVREAGIFALRDNREIVTTPDLEKGLERVMASLERTGTEKILGEKTHVRWDDVIGMRDVKEEVWEVVKMLQDRNMAKAVGGKIIKGLVLFGPSGCGKTYLAKAIATESGFPFISIPGSEFVSMWMGEGVQKMKDVFKEARAMAKTEGGCIIFFDEIDSFARPRQADRGFGGGVINQNANINQFLTELDGLRQQENTILVLGATNASEQELDPAILRAGRLERKIYVTLPTLEERKELFNSYFQKVKLADDVSADRWARIAVGVTPSDIDNIIREAGLLALRGNRDAITHKDLMDAYDRITIGAVSREKYNKASLLKTAYHESGHAIVTYLVHPTNEVIKATIKPRKGSLGYIWNRPIEELAVSSPSKEHCLSEIQVLLAGYVAEKIAIGTTASGVGGGEGSDFYKATGIAHFMVWSLGMGPSGLIGDFGAIRDGHISEKTRETLDNDVQAILQLCLKKTSELLTEKKEVLEFFAQELLEKGDLEYNDVQAVFTKFNIKPAAARPLAEGQ
ncbi:MAG: AAA family ATPase [Candidatus Omnitrophica bacterium]|nr:AAA family ATPase [Candidatus Omnitrophota bacterium]